MRKIAVTTMMLLFVIAIGFSPLTGTKDKTKKAPVKKEEAPISKDKVSYAIGYNIGQNLKNYKEYVVLEMVDKGIKDAMFEKILPNNIHPVERGIRIVLGVVLLSLIFVGPKTWWGLLGLVPLVTGLVGSCPPYTLFGISTCSIGKKREPDKPALES